MPPEQRAKIGRKGRFVSEETRKKLSLANMGNSRGPLSEEHKAKISAAGMGRTASPETRAKLSVAKKGIPFSEEVRNNMSKAAFGNTNAFHYSSATKANIAWLLTAGARLKDVCEWFGCSIPTALKFKKEQQLCVL
jgi:hypothetical protein